MKSLQRKLKNKKGFTLIELIVVIVILGVLAAIAIPKLSGFSNRARWSADIATAKTIATAALTVNASDGSQPTTLDDLTKYLDNPGITTQYDKTVAFYLDWDDDGSLTITAGEAGPELYPDAADMPTP